MQRSSNDERPRARRALARPLQTRRTVAKSAKSCQGCGQPSRRAYCEETYNACKQRAHRRRKDPGIGSPERQERRRAGLEARHDAQAAETARRDLDWAGLMEDGSAQMVPRAKRRTYHESGPPRDAAFDYKALEDFGERISEMRLAANMERDKKRDLKDGVEAALAAQTFGDTFPCGRCGADVHAKTLNHECEEEVLAELNDRLAKIEKQQQELISQGDAVIGFLTLGAFGETPADAAERILGESVTEQ